MTAERFENMRKRGVVILAAALLTGIIAGGCGGNSGKPAETTAISQDESRAGTEQSVKCSEIIDKILKEIPGNCNSKVAYGEDKYEKNFKHLYKTDMENVADGAFAYASEAYADEITVICFNDSKTAASFEEKLTDRIERRKKDFNGYKPEEVKKLDKAEVYMDGNYAVMAVCDDADGVIDLFKKIMKGDK